jgi:hypothetical protein
MHRAVAEAHLPGIMRVGGNPHGRAHRGFQYGMGGMEYHSRLADQIVELIQPPNGSPAPPLVV